MNKFSIREKLIKDAFIKSQPASENRPLELNNLIELMKERSSDYEYLSSIYFAGCIGDHPYFLKNDIIAIGLAVLPEDSKKAGIIKSHPEQIEIIIIVNGSILLEVQEAGIMVEKVLNAGEIYIINKNIKHKISSLGNQNASFFFIKTNPGSELNEYK